MQNQPDTYRAFLGACADLAMRKKVRNGLPSGRVPLGYRMSEGRAVPDGQAHLVRLAFELAESLPLRRVLAEVRSLGLTGANGRPLGLPSLHSMLTNPFYAGFIRYDGNMTAGSHEPLVSMDAFDRVQAAMRGRARNMPGKTERSRL